MIYIYVYIYSFQPLFKVPQHPCLRLVHNIEQVLTSKFSRRLLVMEKILEVRSPCRKDGIEVKMGDRRGIRTMIK